MNSIIYEFMLNAQLILKIGGFSLFIVATILSLMPKDFRATLLAQDSDGKRLTVFGLGITIISLFATTTMVLVIAAAYGITITAFGAIIWAPDKVTDIAMGKRWSITLLYGSIAALIFFFVINNGNVQLLGFNMFGLVGLVIPVFFMVLLGSLAIFSLLSTHFKDRVLPKDKSGRILGGIGVAMMIFVSFGVNPIAILAVTTVATTIAVLGLLVAVPDKYTTWMLQPRLVWLYAIILILVVVPFS